MKPSSTSGVASIYSLAEAPPIGRAKARRNPLALPLLILSRAENLREA